MMGNTGGPAFPTLADNGHAMNQDGMTLRDYFAAKAMQSLLLAAKTSQDVDLLSKGAYQMADAMLKARGQ